MMNIPFENLKIKTHSFYLGQVIHIHGPDARSYLNSQTTNKVLNLENQRFQHNALLDNSGKLISNFIVCLKDEDNLYLITPKEYVEKTYDRLQKYHISEDLEIDVTEDFAKLYVNTKREVESDFKGYYFGEDDLVEITNDLEEVSSDKYLEQYSVLTGVPRIGVEVRELELINNTYLDELAVDYSKGCYPGQETVAKIDSRRGAAFKPVLLIGSNDLGLAKTTVLKNDKKIGEIRSLFKLADKTYAYALLNRESRIDKSELVFRQEGSTESIAMKVHYFPFLKLNKESIATEYYDEAITTFQSGDNERAEELFRKAIKYNPRFEDAYESLGVLLGRLERYPEAIEKMEELRSINSKCLMAYTNLSLYHMKLGNIDTAEKFKSEATLMNFQVLGDAAKVKKKNEELLKIKKQDQLRRESMFLQVLELDPADAMASNGMGEIEFERENFQVASKYFASAIEGDEKYSVAYLGLAKTYLKLGKVEELKKILEDGIRIASKNGDLMPANEMQSILVNHC